MRSNLTRWRVLPSRPDHLADALELLRHALVGGDDFVESVGDLALDAEMIAGHAHREIAGAHRLQGVQQILQGGGGWGGKDPVCRWRLPSVWRRGEAGRLRGKDHSWCLLEREARAIWGCYAIASYNCLPIVGNKLEQPVMQQNQ